MIRAAWMAMVVGLVASTAGCRMCASCNDYSGPVLDGTCQSGCGSDARAGSILSGMPHMAQPVVEMEAQTQMQAQMQMQPSAQMQTQTQMQAEPSHVVSPQQGSPSGRLHPEFGVDPRMIISVTDRKVGESPEDASQDGPHLAEEPGDSRSGWTTQQPVGESVEGDPVDD